MLRSWAALAMAAGLALAASPAAAQSGTASPFVRAPNDRALIEAFSAEVAASSRAQTTLIEAVVAFGLGVMDVDPAALPDAQAWRAQHRAKAEALRIRIKALRAPDLSRYRVGADAATLTTLSGIERLPERTRATATEILAEYEGVADAIAWAAASGKPDAMERLVRTMASAGAITLRAENALLTAGKAVMQPDDPAAFLIDSNIALNDALAVVIVNPGALEGAGAEGKMAAARMRSRIAAAREAADAMESAAEATRSQLGGAPAVVAERMRGVLATYAESAEVEREIAALLERVADAVAQGDGIEPVNRLMEPIEALIERRSALQARRIAAFGGTSL